MICRQTLVTNIEDIKIHLIKEAITDLLEREYPFQNNPYYAYIRNCSRLNKNTLEDSDASRVLGW